MPILFLFSFLSSLCQESGYLTVYGQVKSNDDDSIIKKCHYTLILYNGITEKYSVDSNGWYKLTIKKEECVNGVRIEFGQDGSDKEYYRNIHCPDEMLEISSFLKGVLKIEPEEYQNNDSIYKNVFLIPKSASIALPYFIIENDSIKLSGNWSKPYEKTICWLSTLMNCEKIDIELMGFYDIDVSGNKEMVLKAAEKIRSDMVSKGVLPERILISSAEYVPDKYRTEKNTVDIKIIANYN